MTAACCPKLADGVPCDHGQPERKPTDWLEQLELRTEIEQLAADIVRHHGEYESKGTFDVKIPDFERYPGW